MKKTPWDFNDLVPCLIPPNSTNCNIKKVKNSRIYLRSLNSRDRRYIRQNYAPCVNCGELILKHDLSRGLCENCLKSRFSKYVRRKKSPNF